MDLRREERRQEYYRNYRWTGSQSHNKRSNVYPRHEPFNNLRNNNHFRNRKNGYVFKKDFKHAKRKNGVNYTSKNAKVSTEDAEEEERKKKLSDTANKLLSKIKTWSAENGSSGCSTDEVVIINELVEPSVDGSNVSQNNSGKPKRIAHSKATSTMVKKKQKPPILSPKTSNKSSNYDVNKATVKDFQNRIQHKLINEIMQMPKENLQNVLNDPKINPRMEVKMSRLVRENKLLIAQRLRALAESKITSNDSVTSSQLLIDIDKLIDPVIETDLSVLPYELIKQMENIFQVQFDYPSNKGSEGPQGFDEDESSVSHDTGNLTTSGDLGFGFKDEDKAQVLNCSEDLGVYECSTDEDAEVEVRISDGEISGGEIQCILEKKRKFPGKGGNCSKKKRLQEEGWVEDEVIETKVVCLKVKNFAEEGNILSSKPCVPENSASEPPAQLVSTATQTVIESKVSETQTYPELEEPNLLYGVPLPRVPSDDSPASLLEEINSIQNLLNVLNERRFMIFLHLARTNPSGSFIDSKLVGENFIESISNGNIYLVESLMRFFAEEQKVKANKSKSAKKKKKNSTKKQMKGNQNSSQSL